LSGSCSEPPLYTPPLEKTPLPPKKLCLHSVLKKDCNSNRQDSEQTYNCVGVGRLHGHCCSFCTTAPLKNKEKKVENGWCCRQLTAVGSAVLGCSFIYTLLTRNQLENICPFMFKQLGRPFQLREKHSEFVNWLSVVCC